MLKTARRLCLFGLAATCLISCGKSYDEKKVLDYQLYFETTDATLLKAGRLLVDEYNRDVGADVIHFTESSEQGNSPVVFTNGLRNDDGKLGYGQWETHTSQEPGYRSLEGRKLHKTISYSMNLEFDRSFFEERATLAVDSSEWRELYLLFCHEVGHGLQMDHDPKPDSVMYQYIDGAEGIRFDDYFQRVRRFFGLADS